MAFRLQNGDDSLRSHLLHQGLCIQCLFLPGTRLTMSSVIGACLAQVITSHRISALQNESLILWAEYVCAELALSLTIVTACIPYLQPFLSSVSSGLLRNDDIRRRGLMSGRDYSGITQTRQFQHNKVANNSLQTCSTQIPLRGLGSASGVEQP